MAKFHALTTDKVTELESKNEQAIINLAGECMVLLENDGTLPLKPAERKIALYGNGARHTIKGGTGSGDVNTRTSVSICEGLKKCGFEISTESWLDNFDDIVKKSLADYNEFLETEAKKKGLPPIVIGMGNPYKQPQCPKVTEQDVASSGTDIAVFALARNSGEGSDRFSDKGDYFLSDEEKANLEFLRANYKKVIVLLNIGGIMDAASIKAIGANTVLLANQLGNNGGIVVGQVLKGEQIPSGRLTDTWAKDYNDYPSSKGFSHNNGDTDDEYYTEGIYVGYRYFDTFGVDPVYCFGYGKNYTTFTQTVKKVEADEEKVLLEVEVKNTGSEFAGKEVVQVYVSAPGKNKPFQELRGFAKTKLLQPGESEIVKVEFAAADMASYCSKCASWILAKGEYIVRVGSDSRSTKVAAVITLADDAAVQKLTNCFASDTELEELTAPENKKVPCGVNDDRSDAVKITIDAAKVKTFTPCYSDPVRPEFSKPDVKVTFQDVLAKKAVPEELAASMELEELAELCVGIFRSNNNGAGFIGASGNRVPGGAAETTAVFEEKYGIPVTIMADGPAGLRLQPHFKVSKEGTVLPGGEVFGTVVNEFPPDTPSDAVDYYQYCSAIPIAWALASSWNMGLVEECGKMIGEEMKQFGVHYWLAPGMNIHRNPLCGRNFEYYSEDPLISGKCAAADTNGVQSWGGQCTTIKHFAANNCEDNRNYNNSHVSERALREIYLKGFEIAVRESQPLSIMTSYNLINGIHTPNRYDLLQTVLRDEWGFGGVVMTDWFSSQLMWGDGKKYTCSSSEGCIRAGNDLQMPGCEKNIQDIIDGVKTGKITLGDVQFCAANIIRITAKFFE